MTRLSQRGRLLYTVPQMSRRRHISSLPQTHFKVSPVGIQFTYNRPSETLFPLPWCSQVLVWHHCHHVLASSETRQSRPLLFSPRGCNFSMAKTLACYPCHKVRVTFTIAVGKVAKIARWCPLGLSRCCATHFGSL